MYLQYNKYLPEDGLIKPKHVAETIIDNYQSFIYSQTDALVSCLTKNYIKIYIKTAPTHVSVQSHHHQGAH